MKKLKDTSTLTLLHITSLLEDLESLLAKAKEQGYIVRKNIKDYQGQISEEVIIYTTPEKLKSQKVSLKVNDHGSYKGFVSIMITLIDNEGMDNFLHLLKHEHIGMKSLGIDGGWLGFPYYLLFYKKNYKHLVSKIKDNLSEVEPELDFFEKKYGYKYSQETRQNNLNQHQELIKDLESKVGLYE